MSTILSELLGQVLDEKYQIDRELGRGGMGAVYRATHLGTKRTVALKVISPQFMTNEQFVERFKREAEAAGRLRHPNVVNVTDFGFAQLASGRIAYLVMEYLDGKSLAELLARQTRLSLDFIVDIVEQICLAIDNAHQQGIIHRDLKPDNIWLEPNGRGGYNVKVLDFGLAKLRGPVGSGPLPPLPVAPPTASINAQRASQTHPTAQPVAHNGSAAKMSTVTDSQADPEAQTQVQLIVATEDERGTAVMDPLQTTNDQDLTTQVGNLTQVGAVLGTPIYMSPEQCLSKGLDTRSDIYSLGVVIYEMLTGKPPFSGNVQALLTQHIEHTPPPLTEKRPDLPPSVTELVMAALAKDPMQRPSSARSLASALRANAEGEVYILRQAKFYSSNFPWLFILQALLIFSPLIILSLLVGMALRPLAQTWPILSASIFWPIQVVLMLFAGQLNTGACAVVVEQLRRSTVSQFQFRLLLSIMGQHGGALVRNTARGLLLRLSQLPLLFRKQNNFIDLSLVAPLALLEENGPQIFNRSRQLIEKLRGIALSLAIRELSLVFISMLFFAASFSATFVFLGGAYEEQFNMLRLPGSLTIGSCWYFLVFGHPMYAGLPFSVLYFRARQANGELLNEAALSEQRFDEQPRRRSYFSRATWAWMIVPPVLLFIVSLYPLMAQRGMLLKAAADGSTGKVEQLLQSGASANISNFFGHTPLMGAARGGHSEIAQRLVTAGANINAFDKDGDTALIYAASAGYIEVIEVLLKARAAVNQRNNNGETPLICAAKRNRITVVKRLLAAGADANIRDIKGKTARDYALAEGYQELLAILK